VFKSDPVSSRGGSLPRSPAAPPVADYASIGEVQYRVLGSVAVLSGTQPVALGGKRQKTVLALLLANANRAVSQERLVDALWVGHPPQTGVRTLQSYISHLRRVLGDVIDREGEGYVLRAQPEHIDALRFRALVDEARPIVETDCETASELLGQALGLWTGPPYGELGYEEALVAETNRLRDERLEAQELRLVADLACGRHSSVLPEIETLVAEHPYRENLVHSNMLALYRSGRQADALRACATLRDSLRNDLGIDPSPAIQELETRILAHDPVLKAPDREGESRRPVARGYELHEEVGESDLGVRYRSFQTAIGREVGVLVVEPTLSQTPGFVRSFESEMRAASSFEHPHLAPIFDYWRDPSQACVVGPHFGGGSLQSLMSSGPLSVLDVVRLADQLCAALGYLHRSDYAHGLVRAESVWLDNEGNAYLTDTGLARYVPESDTSASGDVEATGRLIALMVNHPVGTDLPPELGHAIKRATHVDPASRYRRIEEFARALRQSVGLNASPLPGHSVASPDRRNPYKGLRAFQETDASDFHGRGALIQEMIDSLAAHRILTVVGPSGSGKSSVVRAGLLPALRRGAVPGSDNWVITDLYPGSSPFEEIESALLRVAVHRPTDLVGTLRADRHGLRSAVTEMVDPGQDILIVIDQFEELFSLVASVDEQRRYLEMLATAVADPVGRIRLILTIRADFFDYPLQFTEFAAVMRQNLITVSPPSHDGLVAAVAQPALDSGVGLEPGLVTRIADAVHQQPGGLPLLQYAMTELFASQRGALLTIAAYEETGGVGGALAQRAEDIYTGLSSDGRAVARQLFLRLVTVDEQADDARRRIRQSEITDLGFERSTVELVLERFGSFRLLTFDRDVVSRAPTVEIAHEALLREWGRLRSWIDERREDLLTHHRLQTTTHDWQRSERDPSYLLRGMRLEQARQFLEQSDISVSGGEYEFIEASVVREEEEQAERMALEDKAARRRKAVIGVLAGAVVVATVIGVYALGQRGDAVDNAALATARELSAVSRELADDDPELGMLLSLEAISHVENAGVSPPADTLSALWHSYLRHRVELAIQGAGHFAVALSRDGSVLATDLEDDRQVVALWDAESGRSLGLLTASHLPNSTEGVVLGLRFSDDGKRVMVSRTYGAQAPEEVAAVDVYDVMTLEHLSTLMGPPGIYDEIDESPSGHILSTSWESASTTVWNPDLGSTPVAVVEGLYAPGFTRDGELVGSTPGVVTDLLVVDWRSGDVLRTIPLGIEVGRIAVSPDRDLVAIAGRVSDVAVYELAGREVMSPTSFASPQFLTWSPDASMLALSGNDADVTVISPTSGETVLTLSGHDGTIPATSWSGDRIATVEFGGGDTRIWNVSQTGLPSAGSVAVTEGSGRRILDPIPNGDGFLLTFPGARVEVLNRDGTVRARPEFNRTFPVLGVISGNGEIVGGEYDDGRASLIEIETGAESFLPACHSPRALSWDASWVAVDTGMLCTEDESRSGLLDMRTGEIVIELVPDDLALATFSPDDRYVAFVTSQEWNNPNFPTTVEVWGLDPLEPLTSLDDSIVGVPWLVPRFSSDGRYLAVGSNGPAAVVVDMDRVEAGATHEDAIVFNREVNSGNTPRAIPNAAGLLVTMGHDGFYRFWKIETGQSIMEIDVRGQIDALSHGFSPDGETLYYMSAPGLISQIPTNPSEMISTVRSSLTRTLTEDECVQYLHTDRCSATPSAG
jgi:DNA-binding SARP family transcriptional activator/WD40 repeat protein